MQTLSFSVSPADQGLIAAIAQRAETLARGSNVTVPLLDLMMEITACHANGCPLDLARLAEATDSALIHDVFGIRNHLDRATGQLVNHFLPRFAVPESHAFDTVRRVA